MTIRFIKAHGAGNDFLLVRELPAEAAEGSWPDLARAICDRHHGVGADGLILFTGPSRIRLFNSDGSEAELSGNGTRCAAAVILSERAAGPQLGPPPLSPVPPFSELATPPWPGELSIETGAGVKALKLLERQGERYLLEMQMGRPGYRPEDVNHALVTSAGTRHVTIVDVGNPQCALLVDDFGFNWQTLGREIETHPHFPRRTNVSFVRVVDRHTIEARFWERGAGATLSSGTGSTGAVVAAILTGRAESPVRVVTLAGDLEIEWQDEIRLRGPAEITARGEFYWPEPLN